MKYYFALLLFVFAFTYIRTPEIVTVYLPNDILYIDLTNNQTYFEVSDEILNFETHEQLIEWVEVFTSNIVNETYQPEIKSL